MDFIPHTEQEKKQMLDIIGVSSLDNLFDCIPKELRIKDLQIPAGMSEPELIKYFRELASQNINPHEYANYIGAGAYEHFIPSVVKDIVSRSEFATSYTPYQPEASQGNLQAMYEYQSMIASLTGMHVSNASLYDGATALAEAALLALNTTGRKRIIVSKTIHPEYRAVLKTFLQGMAVEIIEIPYFNQGTTDLRILDEVVGEGVAAVIVQSPNFFGMIEKLQDASDIAKRNGALSIAITNPISLGILEPPGRYGADIVVGEGQSLGNPLYFGGPYLGFFAASERLMRKIPGRLSGKTTDVKGNPGFVLTLQTREQHIRREKATSNICSNQALNALTAAVYMASVGPEGLREVAEQCIQKTIYLRERMEKIPGFKIVFHGPMFHEFVIQCDKGAAALNEFLFKERIIGGFELSRFYPELEKSLLFCVTETKTRANLDHLLYHVKEFAK
ncbi:MAG: aminomethyl-transferring glycine dehydrogenase subunit GcvPA [bacterium]